MGNTPPTTIEDNKISFALPGKFPFSYSNHPQGLKTSNSEKKLGFLNSLLRAMDYFCKGFLERFLNFPILYLSLTASGCASASQQQRRLEGRVKEKDGLDPGGLLDTFGTSLAPGVPASASGKEETLSQWPSVMGQCERWLDLWDFHAWSRVSS